jgi:hypothetical protein
VLNPKAIVLRGILSAVGEKLMGMHKGINLLEDCDLAS